MSSLGSLKEICPETVIETVINLAKGADADFVQLAKLTDVASDTYTLDKIIDFISSQPQGKKAFQNRPRIGKIDFQQLHSLPENTFGYAYADHIIRNKLIPFQVDQVNNDYEFLSAHIAETHDIWHTVTGAETNILGEIQLEAFYVCQLYASRFWLALITKNLLKAVVYDIELSTKYMDAICQGWMMAKQAKPLFGVEWNLLWETPLDDVRASLNIILPNC